MKRDKILQDIEGIQNYVDGMGFLGQNEYDLHLREEMADYIISLLCDNSGHEALDWFFDKIKSHFEHDGDLLEGVLFTYAIAKLKGTTNVIEVDDELFGQSIPVKVTQCCGIGPVTNENYCSRCGKKINRHENT